MWEEYNHLNQNKDQPSFHFKGLDEKHKAAINQWSEQPWEGRSAGAACLICHSAA
jgi:hypothetical protein